MKSNNQIIGPAYNVVPGTKTVDTELGEIDVKGFNYNFDDNHGTGIGGFCQTRHQANEIIRDLKHKWREEHGPIITVDGLTKSLTATLTKFRGLQKQENLKVEFSVALENICDALQEGIESLQDEPEEE